MDAITILGSAAAEGIPARFCDCEICKKAWKNQGKDIRMTCAYALNERVRIDYGPDTNASELKFGFNSAYLKHLFVTHEHRDHIDSFAFKMRAPGFSHNFVKPLNIYGRATVWNYLCSEVGRSGPTIETLKFNLLHPFQPVELPEEDMTFYPLTANHYHIQEEAVFFVIRHGKAWIMIANDTGYPPEESWKWLEEKKIHFDIVIADNTIGIRDWRDNHMGGKWQLEFHDRLVKIGSVDAKTRYVVNHFSHNGGALHADLEEYFGPHGMEVGYDGMVLQYEK